MPLENLEAIDLITQTPEGKICLVITDSGVTTDPEARLELLIKKLKRYAGEVLGGGLAEEYPGTQPRDFIIRVVCANPPTQAMLEITSVGKLEKQMPVVYEMFNLGEDESNPSSAPTDETAAPTADAPTATFADAFERVFGEFRQD